MPNNIVHHSRRSQFKARSTLQKSGEQPSSPVMNEKKFSGYKRIKLWQYLIVALLTFLVYTPALHNDFTNWDDQAYVKNNPLMRDLSLATVKEMFFSSDLQKRYWMGNYHPLTMLSLNLSYHIANDHGKPVAWIFILTNILLHVINTLLILIFINRLTAKPTLAFFVALLFGVHTLHVESVAWIAERKDVLYTMFFFLALNSYLKYVDTKKIGYYLLSFILFLLSLLSKGQAVSLAITLFLVDLVRKRNIFKPKIFAEKIPFLLLALFFGLIAIEAQKYSLALHQKTDYELYKRIGIAAYGFFMYLAKLILPVHLAALYPYPDIIHRTIPTYYYLFLIPDLSIIGLIFLWYKKGKLIPAFGLAFFVVNIFLLLQLIPVGSAIYADRYSYIPSTGFFLTLVYFIDRINNKALQYSILGIYIALLGFLTIQRTQVWKNSLTLWADTIKKEPKAVVAWNNYGSALSNLAKQAEDQHNYKLAKYYFTTAINSFKQAIKGKPDYANAFYNTASAQYELFRITLDTTYLRKSFENVNKAIAIKLDFKDAFLQRGIINDLLGREEQAFLDYKRVLELDPSNPRALINIGTYYGKHEQYQQAAKYFKRAIKLNPSLAAGYSNLGLVYMHQNRLDSALFYLQKALSIEQTPDVLYNLSLVYRRKDDFNNAIAYIKKAISLLPNEPVFYYTLANLYLETGRHQLACENYKKSATLGYTLAQKALKIYCHKNN